MDLDTILKILAAAIGWVVFGFVCAYSIPQLMRVLKTKNTSGLSIPGYCLFIFSNFGMLAWGIGNAIMTVTSPDFKSPLLFVMSLVPNIILNTLNLAINFTCLSLKINHVIKAKKMGIDEVKLADILLKQQKAKHRKAGK